MKALLQKYLIEFFVIFFSITLSFLVDEWRTARQDKLKSREFLSRLSQELKKRTKETSRFMAYVSRANHANEKILLSYHKPQVNSDSLLELILTSEILVRYDNSLKTWESIVHSGNLNLLNPSIIDSVNALMDCYSDIAWTNDMLKSIYQGAWSNVAKSLPIKPFSAKMARYYMAQQVTEAPVFDAHLFLNNTVAYDAYTSKYLLTKYLRERYVSLPAREQRLIDMIEREL